MLFAEFEGQRIKAEPKKIGFCPSCKEQLIPKCGLINIWHWAHKNLERGECLYKPETEWMIYWKNKALSFKNCYVEVNLKERVADIVLKNRIVELQYRDISPEEMVKISNFYKCNGFLVDWLFDDTEKYSKGYIELIDMGKYFRYKEKWMKRKVVALCDREKELKYGDTVPKYGRIFYHCLWNKGDRATDLLFQMKKIYLELGEKISTLKHESHWDGWGYLANEYTVFNMD